MSLKLVFMSLLMVMMNSAANAESLRSGLCKKQALAAVDKQAKKEPAQGDAFDVKYIKTFSSLDHNLDLEAYYVTTSDESGGCVYHALMRPQGKCGVFKIQDLYCF